MPDDRRFRRFSSNKLREQEFYATARRLREERAAAPKIVQDALRETPRHAWKDLTGRSELLTSGVVDHLGAIVAEELTRNPGYAKAVADLAVDLALAIDQANYPTITLAQTQATAWKNRGNVLSCLARYAEAIEAFENAERCVDPFSTLEHDRAIIRLNLAITYIDIERYTDARITLTACKNVFQNHGDDNLVALSSFYEGMVLERLHQYREAREIYLLLLASSPSIAQRTLAALHQTIGLCSTELGDFDAAETNLNRAIALHRQLGQPLDALKGEHGRGLLLIRRGFLDSGVAHLRMVRHQYLKASLAEEAGLCGLEIVGALLALDNLDNAEALARTIMNEFLAASLNARAVRALGYLSEAITSRKAKASLAADVRRYVLSLRSEPEREFSHLPTGGA